MKVRVLYPTAFREGENEPEAGSIVDVEDDFGKARIEEGSAEPAKAERIERATAAPGEKRGAEIPKK